ncbi:hypothetical protein A0H81_00042 [Grifola frondosa]|uniref:Uncharacterized protein n=1 Tax=Grifola frondosa TaxID=5627 RepID=A0A1C7MQ07_GRIFR|nr:hypothetical protein A0H81_00042 [Grifola frondosa]
MESKTPWIEYNCSDLRTSDSFPSGSRKIISLPTNSKLGRSPDSGRNDGAACDVAFDATSPPARWSSGHATDFRKNTLDRARLED